MLSREQRKEAINQFKERTIERGVFAVKCSNTGDVWVGSSRNLPATRNSIWFSLRGCSHRDSALQAAWNRHGEPAFVYEILQTLKGDVSLLLVPDLLKEAKSHWVAELRAHSLL